MFVSFGCKNYKSFGKESIFLLKASKRTEFLDENTCETKQGRLIKSALVFGNNGSGKSNLIEAMCYMKSLIKNSAVHKEFIEENNCFKFINEYQKIPTKFELGVVLDDVLYNYGFEILNGFVVKEWLDRKDERTFRLIDRKGSSYKTVELSGEFKEMNLLKENIGEQTLVLSLAALFNKSFSKKLVDALDNILVDKNVVEAFKYIENNPSVKAKFIQYIKNAGIGIDNLQIEFNQLSKAEKVILYSVNQIYDLQGNIVNELKLPIKENNSKGTVKFIKILALSLYAIYNGQTVLIDDIDLNMHSALVSFILNLFNSKENKNKAQLICTTHDALLLEENIRRDQVWFVDKNIVGESELYSLVDFKNVRKTDSTMKKYLIGVYGAVPFKVKRL